MGSGHGCRSPFKKVAKLQLINLSCHVVKAWHLCRHNIIIKWGSWSMLLHKKQTFFHVRRVTWKPIMAGFGIGFPMVFFFQSGQGGCVGHLLTQQSFFFCCHSDSLPCLNGLHKHFYTLPMGVCMNLMQLEATWTPQTCKLRLKIPPSPHQEPTVAASRQIFSPSLLTADSAVSSATKLPVFAHHVLSGWQLSADFLFICLVDCERWGLVGQSVSAGRCGMWRVDCPLRMFPGQQHLCVWQRGAIWERLLKVFDCLKFQPHNTITIQWHLIVVQQGATTSFAVQQSNYDTDTDTCCILFWTFGDSVMSNSTTAVLAPRNSFLEPLCLCSCQLHAEIRGSTKYDQCFGSLRRIWKQCGGKSMWTLFAFDLLILGLL